MINKLKELGCEVVATGSRVICDPAPTDTDEDHLVFVGTEKIQDRVFELFYNEDFDCDGDEDYEPIHAQFSSWKKDKLNFIVTKDQAFFNKFKLATAVSKRLNLLSKPDRIVLFQAVLYGNAPK